MIKKVISACLVVIGLMNSGMTEEINLTSIGNGGGYGTLFQVGSWQTKLGPQDFRTTSYLGVDGVFMPYQISTKITSTGINYSFPSNLQSSGPWSDTQRSQWQNNLSATYEADAGSLDSYFNPKGVNWAANSLFATASSGITYDLQAITPNGSEFTKFTTYFGNTYSSSTWGESAAYAVLLDGNLLSSGGNYTRSNPFSDLIEVSIGSNSRFLTLVVLDGGDGDNYDHGVFVAPKLTAQAVPEPSSLSLLAVGLGGLAMLRRRRS